MCFIFNCDDVLGEIVPDGLPALVDHLIFEKNQYTLRTQVYLLMLGPL